MARDGKRGGRSPADDAAITSTGRTARGGGKDAQAGELDAEEREQFSTQFEEGSAGGKENRLRGEQDDEFLVGMGQWDDDQKRRRRGRPTLTINKLPSAYHQIKNDITQNAPGVQITPDDDDAAEDVARVIEDHIRYIHHRSKAHRIRMQAVGQAVSGGYGYWRVQKVWASDRGFNQELRVQAVPNRSAVIDDPNATEADWSDRRYLFLQDDIPKEEAERLYPNNEWAAASDITVSGLAAMWAGNQRPIIEWWTREVTGTETVESEEKDGDGKPVRTRDVPVYKVRCRMMNGREVLLSKAGRRLEWTWEGHWIPFMRMDGWTVNLKGKRHTEGAIHQAKDSQRVFNYATSSMAEHFGISTKTPWTGPAEMFEGYEEYWKTANSKNWPYLPYKPVVMGGVAFEPKRVDPPPAPQVLGAMRQDANADLRDTLAMFQASKGESVNNESGYAREQVRAENDQGNYHYMEGLATAMEFEAQVIIDLLPHVVDTKRAIGLRSKEGDVRTVTVNETHPGGERVATWETLNEEREPVRHYDLSVGRYAVAVQLGPSFATAREEARAGMDSLMARLKSPLHAAILAPFYAKAAGWQDHEKIMQAFMLTLPPEIQQVLRDAPTGDPEATARALKQEVLRLQPALKQAGVMIQQLQGALKDKQGEQAIKALQAMLKTVSERLETISNVTTAKMKAEASLLVAGMRQGREDLGVKGALYLDAEGDQALQDAAEADRSAHMGGGGNQGGGE